MNGGVSSSTRTLDVANESDVISLLKEVRHSTLDPQTKDDIRDVVFDLRANPDQTLIDELQLYVQPIGVTITGGASAALAEVGASTSTQIDTPTPKAIPQMSRVGRARPRPRIAATTVDTSYKSPAANVVSKDDTALTEFKSTPTAKKPPSEIISETATVSDTVDTSSENALARIKEIKAHVNELVGNPVNLIDASNEVGREYMNALLGAMKSASANGVAVAEMKRLEEAFVAVQKTMDTTSVKNDVAATKATVKAVSTNASVTPPVAQQSTRTQGQSTVEITPPVAKDAVMSNQGVESAAAVQQSVAEHDFAPQAATVPFAPVLPTGIQSLATDVENAEAKAEAVEAALPPVPEVSTDPLQNPEVDAGLKQLLTEWNLFKSSGIFGRGNNGDSHKLYLELKNLNMNAVMAGRFESATPEVRQSLADYMNGWRYEQGMIHDAQETFEHYLRRVIRAIIDKRK